MLGAGLPARAQHADLITDSTWKIISLNMASHALKIVYQVVYRSRPLPYKKNSKPKIKSSLVSHIAYQVYYKNVSTLQLWDRRFCRNSSLQAVFMSHICQCHVIVSYDAIFSKKKNLFPAGCPRCFLFFRLRPWNFAHAFYVPLLRSLETTEFILFYFAWFFVS